MNTLGFRSNEKVIENAAQVIVTPNFVAARLTVQVIRRERGLSVRQLALLADVPKSTLDGVLYGYNSEGTIRTWFAIATALNVSIGDLLNHLHDPGI